MEMKICSGPFGMLPNGSFCAGDLGMLPSGSFAACATVGRLATRTAVRASAAGGFAPTSALQTSADAGAAVKIAHAMAQAAPVRTRTVIRCKGDKAFLLAR